MTDLVKQLRGKEPLTCDANFHESLDCDEGSCKCERRLQRRAADEIERLRKALEYYAKTWPLELEANDWTYVHGCKEWGVMARSTLGDEFQ